MIDVILDVERPTNDFADPRARPQVCRKSRGTSALQKQLLEPLSRSGVQLRRATGRATRCHALRTVPIVCRAPTSDRSSVDTDMTSDLNRRPAFREKRDRPTPPTFESFWIASRTHGFASRPSD